MKTKILVPIIVLAAIFASIGLAQTPPPPPPPPPPPGSPGNPASAPVPVVVTPPSGSTPTTAATAPSQAQLQLAQQVLQALNLKAVGQDAAVGPPGSEVTPPAPQGDIGASTAEVPAMVQAFVGTVAKSNPKLANAIMWAICLIGTLTMLIGKPLNYIVYERIHINPTAKDAVWLAKVQASTTWKLVDRVLDICTGFSLTHPALDWVPPPPPAHVVVATATITPTS